MSVEEALPKLKDVVMKGHNNKGFFSTFVK